MSTTKVFFAKELLSNRFICNGAAVPFEPLSGNRGVISLDVNDPLVACLVKAATDRRGGIYSISEAQYNEKKTLYPFQRPTPAAAMGEVRAMPNPNRRVNPSAHLAVAAPVAADATTSGPPSQEQIRQNLSALNPEFPQPGLNTPNVNGVPVVDGPPVLSPRPGEAPAEPAAAPQKATFKPATKRIKRNPAAALAQ